MNTNKREADKLYIDLNPELEIELEGWEDREIAEPEELELSPANRVLGQKLVDDFAKQFGLDK